jgi:hypothetical protein
MNRSIRQNTRLDAVIALPLAAFRRSLTRLSVDELTVVQSRIDVLTVGARWARGGHGIDRHRSPNELGRLARRAEETRRELASRRVASRLLDSTPSGPGPDWDWDKEAA